MKRVYFTTMLTAALVLLAFGIRTYLGGPEEENAQFAVGFLYENDESTPYTYNFTRAQFQLEESLGDSIRVYSLSNVPEDETAMPLQDLVRKGCRVIFTNGYSDQFLETAWEYPEVQFCQVSYRELDQEELPDNYHTFKGEIYQGRYVSGIAAGLKLRELLDAGDITADEALAGFVAAFPTPEVISGFTAFLLGIRSVAPEAVLKVRYTGDWSSYTLEKTCTQELIREGCIVISQHTDTIGPALACEEASKEGRTVFSVGYNASMLDVAPTTALISTRINWTPYISAVVEAVQAGRDIEGYVKGNVHGKNDLSAGFEQDWVQMLDLNGYIAAEGTDEALKEAIDDFRKGTMKVFVGDYTGVDPENPSDTIDLGEQGYKENEDSSNPSFHYILNDVVEVMN